MAQLHCYVPDDIAEQFQRKAKCAHLSTSKFLAKLIKNELDPQWPEGYFDLFGSWEGDPLKRPDQGKHENRLELE